MGALRLLPVYSFGLWIMLLSMDSVLYSFRWMFPILIKLHVVFVHIIGPGKHPVVFLLVLCCASSCPTDIQNDSLSTYASQPQCRILFLKTLDFPSEFPLCSSVLVK